MKTQRFTLKTPKEESNLRQFASTFAKDKPNRRPAAPTFAKSKPNLRPADSTFVKGEAHLPILPPPRPPAQNNFSRPRPCNGFREAAEKPGAYLNTSISSPHRFTTKLRI